MKDPNFNHLELLIILDSSLNMTYFCSRTINTDYTTSVTLCTLDSWTITRTHSDPGEDIVEAAIREAKEETGLDVEFDRIICIRQAHGGILNQSDMFFVCLLHLSPAYKEGLAKGGKMQPLLQEEEIADIKWMTMEDYAAQDLWHGSPLYQEMNNSMMRVAYTAMRENDSDSNGATDGSKTDEGKQCSLIAKTLPLG